MSAQSEGAPQNHTDSHVPKERIIILILALFQFFHILDFVIMMPLGPVFMKEFKINSAEFGLLVSAYTFSAGILGFLGAFFMDRFDRKNALLFVYFGFALGTLFCALAPNYEMLLAARILAGGFGGMIGALVLSIIGDIIPIFRRGKATGVVMSAFSLASVIGVPSGLYLANIWGWHFPFLALAILSFVLLPISYLALPEIRVHLSDKKEGEDKWLAIKTVFLRKTHYYAFAFTTLLMFGGFTVIPFLSPFLVSNVGLTTEQLPYIYFFGGMFTFFTSRMIGILSDTYGKFRVYLILAFASILPVLIITNLKPTPVWVVICITTLFMILVSGRMVPAFAMITSTVEPKIRGSFMSVNTAVQQVASGLASLLSGAILSQTATGTLLHYEIVGIISVFSLVLSVYVASFVKVNEKESAQ
ncbi:transporter, major facilitator family protein [Leptospira ryugenii]|uniref:Transporter, major facilitator family protein n=1 Tax=Leptospira ryugenii TaxID=1917863 RepID=A0A2P2E3Q6_9LEPT|nr:MFS transporter [Leptospira ryugenii]GBF51525.1 transporter, major facilitator family protein [Leptospira ryugenii]